MLHEISPYEFHNEYHAVTPNDEDLMLIYEGRSVLCKASEEELVYPTFGELKKAYASVSDGYTYLFSISGVRFFTNISHAFPDALSSYEYRSIDKLRIGTPKHLAYAGVTGNQLHQWYLRTSYCGRCGEKAEHDKKERAMRCPKCNQIYYPMIAPSVIVGVTDGDRLLVTKYAPSHLPGKHYALVAGYIETGETPEEAVKREVMEEVGLKVRNLRYYKSQPWPFSGSLLLGYYCDLDGSDTVTLDETELSEALFIHRDELPDRSGEVSLTSEMIQAFKNGKNI